MVVCLLGASQESKSSNVLSHILNRRKKYSWSTRINSRRRTLNSPFVFIYFPRPKSFLYVNRGLLFCNSNNIHNFRLKSHRRFTAAIFVFIFLFCYFGARAIGQCYGNCKYLIVRIVRAKKIVLREKNRQVENGLKKLVRSTHLEILSKLLGNSMCIQKLPSQLKVLQARFTLYVLFYKIVSSIFH